MEQKTLANIRKKINLSGDSNLIKLEKILTDKQLSELITNLDFYREVNLH